MLNQGIDLSLVANPPVVEVLICQICKRLLSNPILCDNCDGCFCTACIESYAKDHNGRCVGCEVYSKRIIKPTSSLSTLLAGVKLKCPYSALGCAEVFTYWDLNKHIETCKFAANSGKCEMCGKTFLKKEEDQHLKECECRKEECKFCGKQFPYKELSNHSNTCDKKPVECEGCKAKLILSELEEHTKKCGKIEVSCQKCETKFLREEEKQHDCIVSLKNKINVLTSSYSSILKTLDMLCLYPGEITLKNKIVNDISIFRFIAHGWKFAYDELYEHITTEEELLKIAQTYDPKRLIGVGGKKVDSDVITCIAFGTIEEVFTHTEDTKKARKVGDMYWYFQKGFAFGFSDSAKINLYNADTVKGQNKVSWHLAGWGGYRVGDLTNLYNSKEWKKIILISPQ